MLPNQQADLVLKAITLRGIGSYLHGARLDIRPLTVLCGKNGSGKSTWLKVLNVLLKSLVAKKLPFGFDIQDWAVNNIQLMNAFYHLASAEDHATLADEKETEQYGPPGTIGLEFTANHEIFLFDNLDWQGITFYEEEEPELMLQKFLWGGRCPAGTRFRIRLAHPTYHDDQTATPELYDLVELEIDGKYTITMKGERDPLQRFEDGQLRPRRTKPYELSCSAGFLPLPNSQEPTAVIRLVTFSDLLRGKIGQEFADIPENLASHVLQAFELRISQLLTKLLDGYFYVGAIRELHHELSLDQQRSDPNSNARKRHVGDSGEYAWRQEDDHSEDYWRPIVFQPFSPEDIYPKNCLRKLLGRESDPRIQLIWDSASEQSREALKLIDVESTDDQIIAELTARLLNSACENKQLATHGRLWMQEHEFYNQHEDEIDSTLHSDDPDIDFYYSYHSEPPTSPTEILRINKILIVDALNRKSEQALHEEIEDPLENLDNLLNHISLKCHLSYCFEGYVSHWMTNLVSTGINDFSTGKFLAETLGVSLAAINGHSNTDHPWTNIYSFNVSPYQKPIGFIYDRRVADREKNSNGIHKIVHPCFGSGRHGSVQPPRQLSSGFHQIFPIVVQLGLMKQGEFFGVENPEVHLHPALQLQLSEFLVLNACAGRIVFIETQSDLVIRRSIRAILEEEIPQSKVSIYFTELSQVDEVKAQTGAKHGETGFQFTKINRVTMDNHGRISNWPEGFLDDDIRESQRLIDIMYGREDAGEDDE